MNRKLCHYVVATVIIRRGEKYLIVRRSEKEKIMPGLWSFPGGRLELCDYIDKPRNTSEHWHNVLDNLIMRECYEELHINVKDLKYLKNVLFLRPDGIPTLVLSFLADYDGGKVELSPEHDKFAWVTLREARSFDLIEGIYDEIILAEKEKVSDPIYADVCTKSWMYNEGF